MSVAKTRSRTHMTVQERRCRSALARLVSQRGLLRGNLLQRRRVCGKANCKCTRGELHASLYLVFSDGGRLISNAPPGVPRHLHLRRPPKRPHEPAQAAIRP